MKERMQKTLAEVKGCPQKDRTESEGYVEVQIFMWICEDNIVEVPFDKEHLLERFFDTVCHSKLIEILSRTIKDGRVISLIHKYLRSGVMNKGMFEASEEGTPQGGPLPYAEPHVRWCERSENESRRKTTSFSSYSILIQILVLTQF